MSDPRSLRNRIITAGEDIEAMSERVYAAVAPYLPPHAKAALAAEVGRLGGVGLGLQWAAKYEMEADDE